MMQRWKSLPEPKMSQFSDIYITGSQCFNGYIQITDFLFDIPHFKVRYSHTEKVGIGYFHV